LTVADRAHALLPDDLAIETRAHALMFSERAKEAQALYLAHKGERITEQDNKLWETRQGNSGRASRIGVASPTLNAFIRMSAKGQ
jgi:hypothetical protein